MVLREVDVVHLSAEDLAVLGAEAAAARTGARRGAVVIESDGSGAAWATGPFGEVRRPPPASPVPVIVRRDDDVAVAVCAELSRARGAVEARGEVWERALALSR